MERFRRNLRNFANQMLIPKERFRRKPPNCVLLSLHHDHLKRIRFLPESPKYWQIPL